MQSLPASVSSSTTRIRPRTALVASADRSFRQRLSEILTGLRWQVREAEGGAQAWAEAEAVPPEAIIVDSWLPDLDLAEFLKDFRGNFPHVDLVTAGGSSTEESPRGPYRQELLYALRRCQDTDTAIWNAAPALGRPGDRTHTGPWHAPARSLSSPCGLAAAVRSGPPPAWTAGDFAGGPHPGSVARARRRCGYERPAAGADRQRALHARGQPPRPPGGAARRPRC